MNIKQAAADTTRARAATRLGLKCLSPREVSTMVAHTAGTSPKGSTISANAAIPAKIAVAGLQKIGGRTSGLLRAGTKMAIPMMANMVPSTKGKKPGPILCGVPSPYLKEGTIKSAAITREATPPTISLWSLGFFRPTSACASTSLSGSSEVPGIVPSLSLRVSLPLADVHIKLSGKTCLLGWSKRPFHRDMTCSPRRLQSVISTGPVGSSCAFSRLARPPSTVR